MTSDYFQNRDPTEYSLPSPSETPYATPLPGQSRRSSRYGTPLGGPPSSPPPMLPEGQRSLEDPANEEHISILDPRRFTPTLHASLVSEILSLRRELDSKHKFIDDLETNLQTSRNENDTLTEQLAQSSKENRSAKRQLQQLENGTLSALEELAKERDEVREANADLKNKLESQQKKLRVQEHDSTHVHDMWAKEKETWEGEKRLLERRVHVSESRLKVIMDELANQEAIQEEMEADSEVEDNTRDSGVGHESDTASIRSSPARRSTSRTGMHSRNRSNGSFRSISRNYRMSLMSGTGSEAQGRLNGVSLADELFFDEEEEELDDLAIDSDDYTETEMRARRVMESRQSMRQDEKAKRILGIPIEPKDPPAAVPEPEKPESSRPSVMHGMNGFGSIHSINSLNAVQGVNGTDTSSAASNLKTSQLGTGREVTVINLPANRQYVDTGVQFSPPASPEPAADADIDADSDEDESTDCVSPPIKDHDSSVLHDVEANQSRKRVAATPSPEVSRPSTASPPLSSMISTSSQTLEQPLSPPATPKIVIPTPQSPISPIDKNEVASVSTQTEPEKEPVVTEQGAVAPPPRSPRRAPPPVPLPIPSIAIHPPNSSPGSPKEAVLPPGTKNAWCQTAGNLSVPVRSIAVQTERISVDTRPIKLPPHLLPSAISSKPGTPESSHKRPDFGTERPASSSSAHIIQASKAPVARHGQDPSSSRNKATEVKTEDCYPGNNDNGILNAEGLRRPFRTSSLFAGFDGPSSDEDEDSEADMSDDEFKFPQYSGPMLSSRGMKKHARPFNNPPTPVPEDKEVVSSSRPSEEATGSARIFTSNRNSFEKASKVAKPLRPSSVSRQPSIRRSAMIQSGTAAHQRSRSPSIGSVGSSNIGTSNYVPKPPFPVPTRSSSRKVPLSKSEGSQSPTPRAGGAFVGRGPAGFRQHQRKDSLRKVRSAAVIPRTGRLNGRPRSRSPPLPATPVLPEATQVPPMPNDMITSRNLGHRPQLSSNTSYTGASVASSANHTSVVDSIAATMVGEWMWKYVRKRKTFGGQDVQDPRSGDEGPLTPGTGIRHKRWVWISPYERSVLWSTKQPTSGSALMGKSGRKLTIQSVLDVPDNTPLPRNAGTETIFNRSILILTPARALKFTAVSRERHYLWLTALSFLAHSTTGIPELGSIPPPVPPPAEELPPRNPGATLRRAQIRDSVRLAKGKQHPISARQPPAKPDAIQEWIGDPHFDQPIAEAASPPSIPRVAGHHGRKRSSTGPQRMPPPSAYHRTFSHTQVPSVYSTGSSDIYNQPPSVPSSVYNPASVITSSRTSEASSQRPNFFDAMGTVRMEAFVEPLMTDEQAFGIPGAKPKFGRRRGNSQWSGSTNEPVGMRGGDSFEEMMLGGRGGDPFRGF